MNDQAKFLLRKATGDQPVGAEQELREWLQKGQCKPADLLFDFLAGAWGRVGDHPALVELFGVKPTQIPERKLIYYMSPGNSGIIYGPHSTKEIQGRIHSRDICGSTWIFVEGDKEWRQLRNVKILFEMLPALPAEVPAKPGIEPSPVVSPPSSSSELEISFPPQGDGEPASLTKALEGLEAPAPATSPGSPPPAAPPLVFDSPDSEVDREDPTMAFSVLGLSLEGSSSPPLETIPPPPGISSAAMPPPSKPSIPPPVPRSSAPASSAPAQPPSISGRPPAPPVSSAPLPPRQVPEPDTGSFDGITAQIPMDPIWLVKRGNLETVAGPFKFLDVIKLLEEGKLNKNDKISRVGTNRFVKIQQQYEFNVKFVVETVVANGVEQQRIVIKRRHPRVPYMTEVQIVAKGTNYLAACVNVSAGGILIEMPKGEFALGDIIDIKMMPSLINKIISCKAMVIGKIPKIPPGFALKFENLKPDDKEAIEFFVNESLKREMQKNS